MVVPRPAPSTTVRSAARRRLGAALLLLAVVLTGCGRPQAGVNTGTATAVATAFPSRIASVPPGTPLATPLASSTIRATVTRTPIGITPPSVSPTRAATTAFLAAPAGAIPGLAEALKDVTAIYLEDDWNGLSTIAPVEAHFSLRPGGSGYVGTAQFAVSYNLVQHERTRAASCDVAVPSDAVRAFLTLLASVQGRPGVYTPRFTHTDDYPSLRIVLTTARGQMVFVSTSQGASNVPSGLEFPGVPANYAFENNVPYQALAVLKPYLSYDTRTRLIEEAKSGTPTSTPTTPSLCAAPSSPAP